MYKEDLALNNPTMVDMPLTQINQINQVTIPI